MTLNFIAGLFVWLFLGIPLAGFLLWILTAPFRAMRNAADRRRQQGPKLRDGGGIGWEVPPVRDDRR